MCLLTSGNRILPWNYGAKYLSPNPKQIFKLKCTVCVAFWKAIILKVELSMIKIGELLRKLLSLRSCFLILPPGAHRGLKVRWSVTWANIGVPSTGLPARGWVIAHENWTSCVSNSYYVPFILIVMMFVGNYVISRTPHHYISTHYLLRHTLLKGSISTKIYDITIQIS